MGRVTLTYIGFPDRASGGKEVTQIIRGGSTGSPHQLRHRGVETRAQRRERKRRIKSGEAIIDIEELAPAMGEEEAELRGMTIAALRVEAQEKDVLNYQDYTKSGLLKRLLELVGF